MAIAFVDASLGTNYGSSLTITLPTYAEDDLLLAFVGRGQNDPQDTWDDDGGGGNGWTRLVSNYTSLGRDEETAIFYKVAGASESNPTFTHGGNYNLTGIIASYRGGDTSSPFDVAYNNSNHYLFTLDDSTPTPPAITTATDGAVVIVMSHINNGQISVIGAPTNYTLRESNVDTNANIMLADRTIASAGTETPGAWNNTTSGDLSESHSYTLAIKPAGAGPEPPEGIIPLVVYNRMMQGIQ